MSDETELADALVEAGIGSPYGLKLSKWYSIPGDSFGASGVSAEQFITDWRVAGKVLESLAFDRPKRDLDHMYYSLRTISSPRAIIEAWYAGREAEK